jgi:hypothetical protein
MFIRKGHFTGILALSLSLAGCASNMVQVQHGVTSKNVRGVCAADFTTDSQGRRSAEVIRHPGADSGFVSGPFAADIKLWVTATGAGTRLVTLHATPQDEILTIPVERIVAIALQSCEVVGDGEQEGAPRVLTTAN